MLGPENGHPAFSFGHPFELTTVSQAWVLHAAFYVVDDDVQVHDSLCDLLDFMDYQVSVRGSASDFLQIKLPDEPAWLLLDVRLPGTSGLEL